jgi:hypothetical protein
MKVFGLLTTSRHNMALMPMGHQPIFVILLEALMSHNNDADVHVIVAEKDTRQFDTEITRWFPYRSNIHIFSTESLNHQDAVIEWISHLNLQIDCDIICIDAHYPLITSNTISQFEEECEKGIMVAKIKRPLFTNARVFRDNDNIMIVYGGIFRSDVAWLIHHQEEDWIDLLSNVHQWYMHHGYVVKDSVIVTNREEHLYAEHIFLEKKHSLFLNQCYSLWKKCLRLEERIQRLESLCDEK